MSLGEIGQVLHEAGDDYSKLAAATKANADGYHTAGQILGGSNRCFASALDNTNTMAAKIMEFQQSMYNVRNELTDATSLGQEAHDKIEDCHGTNVSAVEKMQEIGGVILATTDDRSVNPTVVELRAQVPIAPLRGQSVVELAGAALQSVELGVVVDPQYGRLDRIRSLLGQLADEVVALGTGVTKSQTNLNDARTAVGRAERAEIDMVSSLGQLSNLSHQVAGQQ